MSTVCYVCGKGIPPQGIRFDVQVLIVNGKREHIKKVRHNGCANNGATFNSSHYVKKG